MQECSAAIPFSRRLCLNGNRGAMETRKEDGLWGVEIVGSQEWSSKGIAAPKKYELRGHTLTKKMLSGIAL